MGRIVRWPVARQPHACGKRGGEHHGLRAPHRHARLGDRLILRRRRRICGRKHDTVHQRVRHGAVTGHWHPQVRHDPSPWLQSRGVVRRFVHRGADRLEQRGEGAVPIRSEGQRRPAEHLDAAQLERRAGEARDVELVDQDALRVDDRRRRGLRSLDLDAGRRGHAGQGDGQPHHNMQWCHGFLL